MAYVDWFIDAVSLSSCNCDWGCPCQFNSIPSKGHCRAAMAFEIKKGHFGDVSLDGLRACAMVAWPGAIHLGGGECLPIVDERASEAQRNALLTILSGGETDAGANIFNIFASTYAKVHEPQFLPIEFSEDRAAGTGSFSVPNYINVEAAPITNPMTGEPHRVLVVLESGFEYTDADYVNTTTRATGPIPLEWDVGHGHLCNLRFNNEGMIRA